MRRVVAPARRDVASAGGPDGRRSMIVVGRPAWARDAEIAAVSPLIDRTARLPDGAGQEGGIRHPRGDRRAARTSFGRGLLLLVAPGSRAGRSVVVGEVLFG